MIWVPLIGLPVLILFCVMLVFGIPDTDVPGSKTAWYVGMSVVLFVLSSSFIIHLLEIM